MKSVFRHEKTYVKQQKLNPLEKQVFLQYTFDQNAKRFLLCFVSLENIANFLLKLQNGQFVSKH